MKDKRIFKDFQASQMQLNIYTSPLLAFVFVFIGEFVAFTLYGISFLALIGIHSLKSLFACLCRLYYPILDFTGNSRRSGIPCMAPSSIGIKNQFKTCCSYI